MNEWTRICVLRYVRDVAAYERRIDDMGDTAEKLRTQAEHLGAIRYDREGSASAYADHLPDVIDRLNELADAAEADVELWGREYLRAKEEFARYLETRIVWWHYGERKIWAETARMAGYSASRTRDLANRGIEIIWHSMPEEYRRSPYPAEEWKGSATIGR